MLGGLWASTIMAGKLNILKLSTSLKAILRWLHTFACPK